MTAGDAAWESMSMRQLRSECKSRCIDVSGCFERPDFISRLQAASAAGAQIGTADATGERADAAGLHARATSSRGGCAPEDASGSSRVGGADAWDGMSVRELRRQGAVLSVDLAGCHDKSEMIERLRRAAEASAAGDTRCTDDRGGNVEPPPDAGLHSVQAGVVEDSRVHPAAHADTTSSHGHEAGASTGKPLEAMSVRELKQECYRRGIGVTGCYDKGSFIGRLRAVAPGAGDAPTETRPPSPEMPRASVGTSVPDSRQGPKDGQEVPTGQPLSHDEADLNSMSTRELRKLCELHGIDFSACFDKADVVSKLRAAAGNNASGMGRPADRTAHPPKEADDLGSRMAASDVAPDAKAGMPQAREPSTVSDHSSTLPSSIPTETGRGTSGEATPAGVKPLVGEGIGAREGSDGAVADGRDATAQNEAAGSRSSRRDNGKPLEAVPMRQLKQECEALGIDITGCYAKSEIINRLRVHASYGGSQQEGDGAGQAAGAKSHQEADGPIAADKRELHDKAGSEVPLAASHGAAEDSECKRWEGMSMRQLKRECEDRGISHTGCYSKCEVIRLLQDNGSSAVGKPRQRQQIANPNEPDVQEIIDPMPAASEAERWHAMSADELRIECELHGVDMLSCSNVADVIRQLEASRQGRRSRVHLADKASQSESEPLATSDGRYEARRPADTTAVGSAAQQPPARTPIPSDAEERRVLPQHSQLPGGSSDLDAGVGAEPSRPREVALHCGRSVELSVASVGSLSARELRQESDARGLDLDGCLDKADIVERLLDALKAWVADTAEKRGNTAASGQKISVEGPPREEHSPNAGLEHDRVPAARERLAPGEASAAGSVGPTTGGNAWETFSMRQLKSECKARGIDVTACFDKASIISRLRAASRPVQAEPVPSQDGPRRNGIAEATAPPAARTRLSIADLYKLTVDELRQKCLEEGLAAGPQEPKGALISRLRQLHSRPPGLARRAAPPAAAAPPAQQERRPPAAADPGPPAAPPAEQAPGRAAARSPAPSGKASSRAGAADGAAGGAAAREAPEAAAPGGEGEAAASTTANKPPPVAPGSEPINSFFDFDDLPDEPAEPAGSSKEKKATEAKATVSTEEAKPPAANPQEENWDGKPMSELKRECHRRNIDLTGCFDKAEIIRRLQGGTTSEAVKPPGSKANLESDSTASSPTKAVPAEQQTRSNPDPEAAKAPAAPPVTPATTTDPPSTPPSSEKTTGDGSSPKTDTNSASASPVGASGTPAAWSNCSVKELLKMAKEKGIDVSGCCEKKDIIERLERGPTKAPTPTKARGDATRRAKSAAAPRTSSAAPKVPAKAAPKAPSASSWSSPSSTTEREAFPGWRSPAVSKPSSPATGGTPAKPKAEQASRNEDDPRSSPSGNLCWSSRVRRYFDCYPGFNAILPPEAETWTDQQLEVYFGSNGEIWPAGKRPSWMGRPFEEPKTEFQVPKKKQYPDLKEHFETLDLAETTPPDMIRRHYRRLARDHHPDKHPDEPEAAAERFRKIAAAYEAIKDRLHL